VSCRVQKLDFVAIQPSQAAGYAHSEMGLALTRGLVTVLHRPSQQAHLSY
jgi:hypothetical protein